MERTSSLDLFRSSADGALFSDLTFLDGQEPLFDASVSQAPSVGLQPSQAVPATLPSSSTHLTSGQVPSSKLFHSNRVATAPVFSNWPQAATNAYTSSSQPGSMRRGYLSYDTSTVQRPATAADSQTDSYAALLADDTALGFADDCFRRESDLFFSQERAANADVLSLDPLPGLHADDAASGHVDADTAPPHLLAADTAPEQTAPARTDATQFAALVTAAEQAPAAITAQKQPPAITAPEQPAALPTAQEQSAAATTASDPVSQEAPHVSPSAPQATAAAVTSKTVSPEIDIGPASDTSAPGQSTDSAQMQPLSAQSHTDTSIPARAEHSLESAGLEHPAQDCDGQPVAVPAAAATCPLPQFANTATVDDSSSPMSTQSPLTPSHQSMPHWHQSPAAQGSTQQAGLSQACAKDLGAPPPMATQSFSPQAGLHSQAAAVSASPAEAGLPSPEASTPKHIQPASTLDSLRRTSSDDALGGSPSSFATVSNRPLLSVQEYRLPSRSAKFDTSLPAAEADRAASPVLPEATRSAGVKSEGISDRQMVAPASALPVQTEHVAAAGPDGPSPDPPTAPPVSRHWSHQLTQVFKAAAASLPGRTGHLPMSDGKLPVVASQQPLAPELAISTATDETVAEAPQLASNTDQPQDPQHSPVQLPQRSRADVLTAVAQPPSQQERQSEPAPIIVPHATGPHHGHLWPSDPAPSSAPAQLVDSHLSAPPDLTSITAPQLPQTSVRAPMPDSAVAVSKQGDRLAAADTGGASPGPPSVPPPKHQTGGSLAPTSISPITHQNNVTLAPDASALVKTETQGQCQLDSPELPALAPQFVPPADDLQPVQPQEPVTAYHKAMPISQAAPASISIPAQAVAQALQTETIHLPRRRSPVSAAHSSALHAQQAVTPNQETLKAEVKQTELDLAPQVVAANLAVPTVLAECLASNRIKRVPGGDPLEAAPFRRFVDMVRNNSHDFEAQGRVLRLKQYINADVRPAAINAVLEALAVNTLVEVLYIQNFEQGMFDEQLVRLTDVLKKGRIWALNAGENFEISLQAWERFSKELQHTAVAYMYVSEHHLARTDLKRRMQDAIRDNRRQAPRRDGDVTKCVRNMWWNPKLPTDLRSAAARPAGGESALASLARDMAASQAGSRQSGSGSQSRKRKLPPQDTAVSSHGHLKGQANGKSVQKDGKRHRPFPAATSSAQSTDAGSEADMQAQMTPAEKRGLRMKRREQRQTAEAGPGAKSRTGQDTVTAASSPTSSQGRAPASAPSGLLGARAQGLRSRLAGQSGPSICSVDDSDDADVPAAMAVASAAVTAHAARDSPYPVAVEATEAVLTGCKRKRTQLQAKHPQAAVASSVRLANSTDASNQLDPDAMTEQSRSSEAVTPVGLRRRRSQAYSQSELRAAQHAQQGEEDEEFEIEQTQHVRRTGRQRKLTAAAVAAVEDFPSLYKQAAKQPASASKAKDARDASDSNAVDDDWPGELASAGKASRQGQSKHVKARGTPSNGMNLVQMSQLVRYGVLPAGRHEFVFRTAHACEVEVLPDGDILYQGDLYDSLAKFGRAVVEETSSGRQSCNCWRDVSWQGQKMETLRQAAHNKSLQSKRIQKK